MEVRKVKWNLQELIEAFQFINQPTSVCFKSQEKIHPLWFFFMVGCFLHGRVLCSAFVAEAVLIASIWLLLGSLMSRFSFLCSAQTGTGGCEKCLRQGTVRTADTSWPRGIPYNSASCPNNKGEESGLLVFVFLFCVLRCCSPGSGWTSACQWKVVNFSIWLYLHAWVLPSVSNCHYFDW